VTESHSPIEIKKNNNNSAAVKASGKRGNDKKSKKNFNRVPGNPDFYRKYGGL